MSEVILFLDLPDELPDEPMDVAEVMKVFEYQILNSYYGGPIPEDADENTLSQMLDEHSVPKTSGPQT